MRPIVQHPKIASLTPVWAAFAGYSFICDQSDAPVDRHTFAVCKETITAFNTVEAALAKFGIDRLMSNALLCLLDASSYHVTAVDLINDDNVKKMELGPLSIEAVDDLDAIRTGSAQMPSILTRLSLPDVPEPFNLRFQFDGLDRNSSRALMMRMAPVDATAQDELDRLKEWRRAVGCKVLAPLGMSQNELKPHLTLGYYANQKRAKNAADTIRELERFIAPLLDGQVFAFDSVSLYGFETMERFFKIGA